MTRKAGQGPHYEEFDASIVPLVETYIGRFQLPTDDLYITSERRVYGRWLGRRIASAYGGAYCYLRQQGVHAVLINPERIDLAKHMALEVVVAEELLHMRDHLDGDHRGHAKHGYDRIAHRVSDLTGASLEQIRTALIPVQRRPYRYIYECPGCGLKVPRKRTGRWSCRRCSPRFDLRYVLKIVERLDT